MIVLTPSKGRSTKEAAAFYYNPAGVVDSPCYSERVFFELPRFSWSVETIEIFLSMLMLFSSVFLPFVRGQIDGGAGCFVSKGAVWGRELPS